MTANSLFDQVRTAIGRDLAAALKARDRVSAGALRCALNVLDNATAVPDGAASAPSAEVARRTVERADMVALLLAEARERAEAAIEYRRLGHPERAQRLHAEGDVIRACLRHLGSAGT